jgi:hypothetical protein
MRRRYKLARKGIGGVLDTAGTMALTSAPITGPVGLGIGLGLKGVGAVANLITGKNRKQEEEEKMRRARLQGEFIQDQQTLDSYNRQFNQEGGYIEPIGDRRAVAEVEDDETLMKDSTGKPVVGSDKMTIADMSKYIQPEELTILGALQEEAAANKEAGISYPVPTYKGNSHGEGGISVDANGNPLSGGYIVPQDATGRKNLSSGFTSPINFQTLEDLLKEGRKGGKTDLQPVRPPGQTPLFKSGGGIYIKPSKRGTFTAAAKKRGKGVQEFASQVLANKSNYSPAMVKKANFARNASKWKKQDGGVPLTEQDYLMRSKVNYPFANRQTDIPIPAATNPWGDNSPYTPGTTPTPMTGYGMPPETLLGIGEDPTPSQTAMGIPEGMRDPADRSRTGNLLGSMNKNQIGDVAKGGMYLFDFINNQSLIKNLPNVPKPLYERPVELERFTPDQHLREIGRSESATNLAVTQNISNPQYALQASRAQSLGAQGKAVDAVNRANIDIQGREALINNRTQMRNVMRGNQYMKDILDRDLTIRNLRGENVTNFANKIAAIFSDRERMEMWREYFNNFGGAGDQIQNLRN